MYVLFLHVIQVKMIEVLTDNTTAVFYIWGSGKQDHLFHQEVVQLQNMCWNVYQTLTCEYPCGLAEKSVFSTSNCLSRSQIFGYPEMVLPSHRLVCDGNEHQMQHWMQQHLIASTLRSLKQNAATLILTAPACLQFWFSDLLKLLPQTPMTILQALGFICQKLRRPLIQTHHLFTLQLECFLMNY